MTCSTTATFKRGSSFACSCVYTPGSGPATLADVTIESNLVDTVNGTYAMTAVKAEDNLSFTLAYPSSTQTWALGLARWDIKFTYGGSVFFSQTLRVNIIDSVTV